MPSDDDTYDDDPMPTSQEIVEAQAEFAAARAARLDGTSMALGEDVGGGSETLHFDDTEETFTIKRVEDVEATLDWCKGRYNEGLANRHCEFRHVARIPVNVLILWGRMRGLTDPAWYLQKNAEPLIKEVLADRDLCGFRTLPGRI